MELEIDIQENKTKKWENNQRISLIDNRRTVKAENMRCLIGKEINGSLAKVAESISQVGTLENVGKKSTINNGNTHMFSRASNCSIT